MVIVILKILLSLLLSRCKCKPNQGHNQLFKMKNAFLLLILFSLATVAFSQKIGSITSIKQLSDSIEAIIKQEKITGLMLGIATKDSVIFSGGFGYADLDIKRKVDGNLFMMRVTISRLLQIKTFLSKLLIASSKNSCIANRLRSGRLWNGTDDLQMINISKTPGITFALVPETNFL